MKTIWKRAAGQENTQLHTYSALLSCRALPLPQVPIHLPGDVTWRKTLSLRWPPSIGTQSSQTCGDYAVWHRYNMRPLLMILGVTSLAVVNACLVPIKLEQQIVSHPRAQPLVQAAVLCEAEHACWANLNLGLQPNPFADHHAAICPTPAPHKM